MPRFANLPINRPWPKIRQRRRADNEFLNPMTIPLPDNLPTSLHEETAVLLERFAAACGDAVIPGAEEPAIARLFALSPFVAEFAIRHAETFLALIDAEAITEPRDRTAYDARIAAALENCTDRPAAKTALRRVRQAEMARIAWRDIMHKVPVDAVMHELSALADAMIAAANRWAHTLLEPRFGRALDEHGEPLELLVLGMGKLGGHELNFSSDIDLIFIYGDQGETVGGRREIEHQEYFDRVGRELIALLNETTADGFVFRVDMRLRPFGDSGPLTASLQALEHYYAVHGRDWERYALIKARPITGDAPTVAALEDIMRPFVYRRYLDFGALDALREMKALINREASSAQLADNVKRGVGGIREIEFTGQLFQLIRGGREPRLRDRSLVHTLGACAELGLLEADEVDRLLDAYRFLRTTEHRLQQVRDQQTHSLPNDTLGRARLAYAFDCADWASFNAQLDAHRQATNALFSGLLEAPDASEPASTDGRGKALWAVADDKEALAVRLESAGDAAAALEALLASLKSERFVNRLSREARERFDRLMPLAIERVLQRGMSGESIKRFGELLHAIARRSVYLAFLADNPDALERLLELFDASPWIADQIIAHPLLLDELLDSRTLYAPPGRESVFTLINSAVRPEEGLEVAMDQLRAFRNQQVLRVAASDVTGHLPVARVSDQLTFIAEACITRALEMAWADLTARFGAPRCVDDEVERTAGFVVIGYGKLGGWELGYGSDLDLVFVHDSAGEQQQTDGAKCIENDVFFTRLAQRFIHLLSTTTGAGTAYEIDTRLRPSGNAGLVVTSITAFERYLADKAWVWELQALVRARAIAGPDALAARFDAARRAALASPRDADMLRKEIVDMRSRMVGELDRGSDTVFDIKRGRGGMTDIEFMVQYVVLRWAATHSELLAWTDNLRLLEIIADLGLLPAAACERLHDAYFAYRADVHHCALQRIDGLVEAGKFREHREHVLATWSELFPTPRD